MATSSGNKFLNFANSNGGSSLITGILGGLGSMGQGNRQDQQNQQNAAQNSALMQQQFGTQMQDNAFRRDSAVSQASPLGWSQNYQQQQLMKNMLMQKLMAGGSSLTPTSAGVQSQLGGYKPFQPTMPDDWKNVNPFGADQTMGALVQRQNTLSQLGGGNASQLDFSNMGLSPEQAASYQGQIGQFQQGQQERTNTDTARLQEAVNMSRNAQAQQQKGGGGGWKGVLGKALKMAAPFASFIPGVGPLAGMALGAAGGALGNKLDGGSMAGGAMAGAAGSGMTSLMNRQQPQQPGQGGSAGPSSLPQWSGQVNLGGPQAPQAPRPPMMSFGQMPQQQMMPQQFPQQGQMFPQQQLRNPFGQQQFVR